MQRGTGAVTRQDVERQLRSLINEIAQVPVGQIVPGATIDDELQMESVAFVELQVAIEDVYGIEIDPIAIVELNEFGAVVDYVYERVARRFP